MDHIGPKTFIGCAGWGLRSEHAALFPAEGSHLTRYAGRFRAVEINSSFYRPHRPATYARWAASVPEGFSFAVKVPKEITHVRGLREFDEPLTRFLGEASALGTKLGPLLVQLPPSGALNEGLARAFFAGLRERFAGDVVCEPRHETWFTAAAEALLIEYRVARVAADPAPVAGAETPAGFGEVIYYRLHGSPQMYYSAYPPAMLAATAASLAASRARRTWCIFDNTALGAATTDALSLIDTLGSAT